ncbi:MAG: class I SAM-dependent methyltransferase [Candidatus Hodarchaeales archaeon]|jgi:ubiquinone/menaquinone biosynthesis C-methylase UbiE
MISNKELKGVNSPFRNFSLKMKIRSYKKQLENQNINLKDSSILDAGCGRGFSTQIIIDKFQPEKIYAFDFIESQIDLAKMMNLDAKFWVGSITDIDLPSSSCDFVFVFNVLHHVLGWREGIKEIFRVLRDEGHAIFEEPTGGYTTFTDRLVRNKHPEEGKFSKKEFEEELLKNNFFIIKDSSTFFGRYIALICQKKEKSI